MLHVTLTPSRRGGGVAAYVWSLAQWGRHQHMHPTIAGLTDACLPDDAVGDRASVPLLTGEPRIWRELGISPELWRQLDAAAAEHDVIHIHGLRTLLEWKARRIAQKHGKPLVISPHGQLHPWLLRQRVWRKRLVDTLWTRRDLQAASVLHTVSLADGHDARRYEPSRPVAVVPIGVDAAAFTHDPATDVLAARWPRLQGKKLLLYCSLLTPRKGLPFLIEAWGRLAPHWSDWHLVIAGIDADGYRPQVEAMISSSGVGSATSLVGEVDDATKKQLLASAELLVLPTLSEAFGIIVLEALASSTPVLTTRGAPWPELEQHRCGRWIEIGTAPLVAALEQMMSLPAEERRSMGRRGRDLVEKQYTWQHHVEQMRAVYDWVCGEAGQPSCVFLPDQPLPSAGAVAEPQP